MWSTYFFLDRFIFCVRLIFLRQIYISDLKLLTDFLFMWWQTFCLCSDRFINEYMGLCTPISISTRFTNNSESGLFFRLIKLRIRENFVVVVISFIPLFFFFQVVSFHGSLITCCNPYCLEKHGSHHSRLRKVEI